MAAAETELEEVVVTAGFRDMALMESAGSFSILDEDRIRVTSFAFRELEPTSADPATAAFLARRFGALAAVWDTPLGEVREDLLVVREDDPVLNVSGATVDTDDAEKVERDGDSDLRSMPTTSVSHA